ncbi:MAG: protein kinase, partial [Planctomycetota bacterium]|nr:protein kinase [Planctomycetota bacterium]
MDPNQFQAQLLLQSGLMSQSQIEVIYNQLPQYQNQDLLSLVVHNGCIDQQTAQGLRQQFSSYESAFEQSDSGSHDSAHPNSSRLPHVGLGDVEHGIVESVREVLKENAWFKPTGELCWLQKEILGEGGMGKVYRVEDICLGRDAALKIMHTEDAASLSRFKREVIITAKLDHPSIPPVYEAGRTADGVHYMVMKIVEGDTLKDRIARVHESKATQSDIRELLRALIKVGEALSYAHTNGIVHRDLKPENIMLGNHGEVFVMDWGIARDLNVELNSASEELLGQALSLDDMNRAGVTLTGVLIGTPGYMAPEQTDGLCSEKNDIFALGVILTEILTGKKAIPGDSMIDRIAVTVSGKAKTPRQLNPKVSRELDALAQSALEVDDRRRLDSAKDLVENLNAYLTGEPLPIYNYSAAERVSRWTSRRPGWILGFAASFLFLSASIVGLQAFKKSEQEKNVALDIAGKAQDNEARTKAAFLKLREAEILVERESPKEKVLAAVEDALALGGKDYSLLLSAASICKSSRLIDRAEELLNEATESQSRAYEALFMLHELEMLKHPHSNFVYSKSAQELVRRSRKHKDENEFTVIIEAIELYSKKQYADALRAIEKIEQYSTKIAYGYYIRGMVQAQLKMIEAAKKNFGIAIRKDPLFSQAYNSRGALANREGRYRDAFMDFTSAIKINPGFVLAYSNRSQAFLNLRKPRSALKDIESALKLDPNHAASYTNRAVIRAQLNDAKGVRADLDEALRLDPTSSLASINRAILRHNDGERKAAVSDLENALKHDPECGLAYTFRGRLKFERKDFTGAIKDFGL